MEELQVKRVAFVGTHLPRQCGIATFTSDLCEAVAAEAPETKCFAVAVTDIREGYRYPERVRFEIAQNEVPGYRRAADFLNTGSVDVVCVQHEYGIFGGPAGSHILTLLQDLRAPVVTTLHTVPREPLPGQRKVMEELARISDRLVVMTDRAVRFLREIYGVDEDRVDFIHHGIPDVPFVDPNLHKDMFGVAGRPVVLSFGLLSPGKGIEDMLDALPAVRKAIPEVVYVVLGATHPNIRRESGEDYRLSLQRRTRKLGIHDNVIFLNRFVELSELCKFMAAADIYVTPYLNRAQIVSGTLAYAVGAGKAVVSTPYWYAEEILADGRGRLVPFRDPDALAAEITDLLTHESERQALRRRAYDFGRQMIWREVARRYLESFGRARAVRAKHPRPVVLPKAEQIETANLTPLNLAHLRRMTDGTGLLQHAVFTVPNYRDGYCTDDNARALVLAAMAQRISTEVEDLHGLVARYLAFVNLAIDPDTGRARNFLSYDRTWLKKDASEDCHGRALWGLGAVVAYAREEGQRALAMNLFGRCLKAAEDLIRPRAWAFALVGIHEYLRRYSGDAEARRMREVLAGRLFDLYRCTAARDWPWFEDIVTYANAKLPHALILSGQWMQRGAMTQAGLRALKWLARLQTSPQGHFAPIGSNGFYPRGGPRARFDQQPIEAHAMVSACLEAHRMTGDMVWYEEARRAFEWLLGRNDLRTPLYDFRTGGCHDGLHPDRINRNQGAESTLAALMSIVEMQLAQHVIQESPE